MTPKRIRTISPIISSFRGLLWVVLVVGLVELEVDGTTNDSGLLETGGV